MIHKKGIPFLILKDYKNNTEKLHKCYSENYNIILRLYNIQFMAKHKHASMKLLFYEALSHEMLPSTKLSIAPVILF